MRLNSIYRSRLKDAVRSFIFKEYVKSEFGQEFVVVQNKFFERLKAVLSDMIPDKDMIVLDAYGFTKTMRTCRLSKNHNMKWYLHEPFHKFLGDFYDPVFCIPEGYENILWEKFIEVSSEEELEEIFKVSDRFSCEVKEVLSAYNNLIESTSTVKSLVKKSTIFKQFLHVLANDPLKQREIISSCEENKKIIESFEQSIKE